MKRFFAFLILCVSCFTITVTNPSAASAQNSFDKWFCQSLKMNAILSNSGGITARDANILNINGAGIYGTDTTLFIAIPDQHKNSWWAVYAKAGRIGTGTTATITLKASMDGITTFDLPGDTASKAGGARFGALINPYKISSANASPFYKFSIATSNSSYSFGPFEGFPFPYAAIYITKGNDSTTISSKIYFTPPRGR